MLNRSTVSGPADISLLNFSPHARTNQELLTPAVAILTVNSSEAEASGGMYTVSLMYLQKKKN
jgi:hypothetical protein